MWLVLFSSKWYLALVGISRFSRCRNLNTTLLRKEDNLNTCIKVKAFRLFFCQRVQQ